MTIGRRTDQESADEVLSPRRARISKLRLLGPECGTVTTIDTRKNASLREIRFPSGRRYPVVNGIPIIFRADNPFFDAETVVQAESAGFAPARIRRWRKLAPSVGGRWNANRIERSLFNERHGGRCLVVGAGDSPGQNAQYKRAFDEVVFADVVVQETVDVACDVHDLPFPNGEFDFIICIAVLEHVLDPRRAVGEMHRVLREGGQIYVNTPFLQQVHMAAFDFTRFTPLGHRWLFRHFEESASGPTGGPGTVIAWAIYYAGIGVAKGPKTRLLLKFIMRWLVWPWKYLDLIYPNRGGAHDSCSGSYFLGTKRTGYELEATDLIKLYRGAG